MKTPDKIDRDRLMDFMLNLAEKFPNQPVALIIEDGKVKIGLMSCYKPVSEDWALSPIPVADVIPERGHAA